MPYIVFSIILLIPIPIAVLFEAFRVKRSKTIISDRFKEREALLACFLALDNEK